MTDLSDDMRSRVKAGGEAGLADAVAGRGHVLTNAYVEVLKQEIWSRLANDGPIPPALAAEATKRRVLI